MCNSETKIFCTRLKEHKSSPGGHILCCEICYPTVLHEYEVWKELINRCYRIRNILYSQYGGKGVKLCDQWKNSFISFYQDMGPRKTHNHFIKRKDDTKEYSLENCYWSTIPDSVQLTSINETYICENCGSFKGMKRKTPEYSSWEAMKRRCDNITHDSYHSYGGRSKSNPITYCERWKSFENFYKDMGPRPVGKTLERIDNDGNYEPGNCKWATSKEQARNRSTNRFIDLGNRKVNIAQFCEEMNVGRGRVSWFLKKGLTDRELIDRLKFETKTYYYKGEMLKLSEISKRENINLMTLYNRARLGKLKEDLIAPVIKKFKIFYKGEYLPLRTISRITGLHRSYIRRWVVDEGLSIEEAVDKWESK